MTNTNHRTYKTRRIIIKIACTTVLAGMLFAGCSSPSPKLFNPTAYTPFTDNPKFAASKKVVICQPANAIQPKDRQILHYSETFNPADYLRQMLTAELQDRNVTISDISLGMLSGFDEIASRLAGANDIPADAVVLASSIVWIEYYSRFSCDVKVYDNGGNLLFSKRGMSLLYNATSQNFAAAHKYAMKSIFDDPDFQQAMH